MGVKMATIRKKIRRTRSNPGLDSFFAFWSGSVVLSRKYGRDKLKELWRIYGRDFLDRNPGRRSLALERWGEPEKMKIEQ
jgi:hypothetical protein